MVFRAIATLLLCNSLATGQQLAVNAPYLGNKSNPVTYQVDFSAVVTPPYKAKVLKIWLPIPTSDSIQTVVSQSLSTFPMQVEPKIGVEPKHGNKFAYFEFQKPEGAQVVRHKFYVTTYEVNWNVEPDKIGQVKEWPAEFAPYLTADKAVAVDDRFEKLAREIVPQKSNIASDMNKVMTWVNQTMKYSHSEASLQASSEHALTKKIGHCSDYHSLCSAFGRSLGYPSRVVYGINPFPKNSPSHCKLELFLPSYGWVPFDVSETQKLVASIREDKELDEAKEKDLIAKAEHRLAQGFRDNTWFLQTRGTGYDLVPPASGPVNVVRTVYVEADGVPYTEPDPSGSKKEHSWMTVHDYQADKVVEYPFKNWKSLIAK